MIELTTNAALIIYLGLTLAVILTLWLVNHFKSKKRYSIDTRQQLYLCEYCCFVYLELDNQTVTTCPQCQSFNKRVFKKDKK